MAFKQGKRMLVRIFRIAAVTINLCLLAICLLVISNKGVGEGRAFANGVLSFFALLTGLNLFILWHWHRSAVLPMPQWVRLLRAAAWGGNILYILVVCVLSLFSGMFYGLIALIPAVLGVMALRVTLRASLVPAPAPKPQAPQIVPQAEHPAYYARHKEEIDRLQSDVCRLLTDKYGMQPEFVRRAFHTYGEGLPLAVAVHMAGRTAEAQAEELFSQLYHSPQANNPVIFARHVDTGEPLAPDHDFLDWRERLLGRTSAAKAMSLLILPVLVGWFFVFYFQTYLPSRAWRDVSLGISLVLAVLCCVRFYQRHAQGKVHAQPGKRKGRKEDIVWLAPFAYGFIWLFIYIGVGGVAASVWKTPVQVEYAYKKKSGTTCLFIEETEAYAMAQKCLRCDVYNRLPNKGRLRFSGYRSWFGEILTEPAL